MKYLVWSQWPRWLSGARALERAKGSGGRFCFRHIIDVCAFFYIAHHSCRRYSSPNFGQSVMGPASFADNGYQKIRTKGR
jgi:hypothetical protein